VSYQVIADYSVSLPDYERRVVHKARTVRTLSAAKKLQAQWFRRLNQRPDISSFVEVEVKRKPSTRHARTR
jgi:hypothetical protein